MKTPAYKAKAMAPVNLGALSNKGEYKQVSDTGSSRPGKKPATGNAKASMIDGPFGGKKSA